MKPSARARLLPLVLAFLIGGSGLVLPTSASAADPEVLRGALALGQARDWDAAEARLPAGSVAADILRWHRLRAGAGTLDDFADFLARRGDWPGIDWLRNRAETLVIAQPGPEAPTPARVVAWFEGASPVTEAGAMAYLRALSALGREAEASVQAARIWRDMTPTPEDEAELLARHAPALSAHHHARLDRLLWEGQGDAARRLLPLVGPDWRRLAEARLALRADRDGVDALIAAVPVALAGDPGLAFERFEWRMRRGRTAPAQEIMLERSTSPEGLGQPARWAPRRIGFVRAEMRVGDPALAYRLAAGHHLTEGGAFADLEFLAGYVALRKLGDAETALGHFRRLGAGVSSPISLSRAQYWEGRALEALARKAEAEAAYRAAAAHQTAFYGQLAAERAGLALDPALLEPGQPGEGWRAAPFLAAPLTEAALLLHRAQEHALARRFLLHLAEGLDAAGLRDLSDLALAMQEPNIAVLIGKQAAGRGVILPRAYFPASEALTRPEATHPDVPAALTLAIARRESEFDPGVTSPAGALGLMQVMPGTAQLMAGRLGIAHEPGRLLSDAAYNTRLGAAYLAELRAEFGPSLILVAAGYNAGPGRPRAWISDLGDPRRNDVDPVDWIEHVPFAETRNYIMRVAEAVVIYRARLSGSGDRVELTALLQGHGAE